ncbi:MAG: hypothetical protein OEZ43_15340 [Gammaproteobacteria bacterium]|nr:hypothetical protein [Gammaproteobacteria bacterium]
MKKQLIALSIVAALSACGEEEMPNYYTGATTAAPVTVDNVDTIVAAVEDGGSMSDAFDGMFGGSNLKAMRKSVIHAREMTGDIGSYTENGDCGGTMTFSATETSGSVTFSNYCEPEGTVEYVTNGSIVMSGSVASDGSSSSFSYTMDLQVSDGTNTSKSAGTMSMLMDNTGKMTLILNLTANDGASGDSVKLENYEIVLDSFVFVSTAGNLCSSEIEGCVTVSTPVEFVGTLFGGYTAGTLRIAAGTATIDIVVNNSGQCDLTADVNGDGSELVQETQNCSNYL